MSIGVPEVLFPGELGLGRVHGAGFHAEGRREDDARLLEVHPFFGSIGLFHRGSAYDQCAFLAAMRAGIFFGHEISLERKSCS